MIFHVIQKSNISIPWILVVHHFTARSSWPCLLVGAVILGKKNKFKRAILSAILLFLHLLADMEAAITFFPSSKRLSIIHNFREAATHPFFMSNTQAELLAGCMASRWVSRTRNFSLLVLWLTFLQQLPRCCWCMAYLNLLYKINSHLLFYYFYHGSVSQEICFRSTKGVIFMSSG